MTLRPFDHVSAKSLEEAAALASGRPGKASVIAGGTDLLGALTDHIHPEEPRLLIDLKTIPGLSYVREDGKSLRIGALTSLAELAAHGKIRKKAPLLAEAARAVGGPQIRNMGTVGGNLCQEPRCWYYRAPENYFHCLRKGGARCAAFFGDNRYHSVYGAARAAPAPCVAACPNGNDMPSVMSALRRGDLGNAGRALLARNPMPAVTGRVCPHYCENECSRNGFDEPVSIREVERFVGDYILAHTDEFYNAPKASTKKRVAVVGAGPAGLSAAYHLRRAGHRVTVLDKMPEPGGMLAYAVPAYRLPREVIRKQVHALEHMGIEFACGVEAVMRPCTPTRCASGGREFCLADLRKDYDAVFLATGTWRQKTLELEREDLLCSGLEFLTAVRSGKAPPVGRRVLVIGGGSVAVDVAVSARRLGAREVSMACLEPRNAMPALAEDIEQADREGVEILASWGPRRIIERGGVLKGMKFIRCKSVFDDQKRFRPVFDPGVSKTVEADHILLAIGQAADLAYADKSLKTEKGLIAVNPETLATNLPGVYAGGDAASGPATVARAVAAGRRAALEIDAYLGGGKESPAKGGQARAAVQGADSSLLEFAVAALKKSCRVRAYKPSLRKIDLEDRPTIAREAIEGEARRCANCGCVAVNASDLAPALIALGASVKTTKRTISAEDFFLAAGTKTTVLEAGELVQEIFVPAQKAAARQRFVKFRIRNAIDFPILNVACVLSLAGGRVKSARIAIGAAAPVPLRAREAEDYLKGRKLDKAAATEAGNIAAKETMPLAKNSFKVQLVKALLRKALLG